MAVLSKTNIKRKGLKKMNIEKSKLIIGAVIIAILAAAAAIATVYAVVGL